MNALVINVFLRSAFDLSGSASYAQARTNWLISICLREQGMADAQAHTEQAQL